MIIRMFVFLFLFKCLVCCDCRLTRTEDITPVRVRGHRCSTSTRSRAEGTRTTTSTQTDNRTRTTTDTRSTTPSAQRIRSTCSAARSATDLRPRIASPSSASSTRLQSLLPALTQQRIALTWSTCFTLQLIPPLAQVAFHFVASCANAGARIQQLGLDPEDFRKASTQDPQTHGDRFLALARGHRDRTMLDTLLFLLGLSLVLTKGAFQALAVIYPSYKTYKALESRSLKASQAMLLYWCTTAFVNAAKEFADQLLGSYANFAVWKLCVLALKAAPLLIGPDRMYNTLVKPIFEAQEGHVDAVVEEVNKVTDLAKEAVPAIKEGDVDAAKEVAGEIVEQIKSSELVQSVQEKALELTKTLEAKSAEYGFAWNRAGLLGVLEQTIAQFEVARDCLTRLAEDQWEQHGPFVLRQTETIRVKATEYAPIAKQKAVAIWDRQVAPRVQPIVAAGQQKYSLVKSMVLARKDQTVALWQQHGGPVRRVYSGQVRPFLRHQVQPFVTQRVIPFLVDVVLPQMYETLLAMKNQLQDIIRPPTEEIKAGRAHHKRRRADARKEKRQANKPLFHSPEPKEGQLFKRQKTNDLAHAQVEATIAATKGTTSFDVDRSEWEGLTRHPQASLLNRKTRASIDSSLEMAIEKPQLQEDIDEIADKSDLHADAPMFEPNTKGSESAAQKKNDSMARSGSGDKLGQWGNEPRANDLFAHVE